jgi:hypothetical protein
MRRSDSTVAAYWAGAIPAVIAVRNAWTRSASAAQAAAAGACEPDAAAAVPFGPATGRQALKDVGGRTGARSPEGPQRFDDGRLARGGAVEQVQDLPLAA